MSLQLSSDLQLPVDAVTQTFAILAKRGVGKTYTAAVFSEELLKAGLHTVIADPVGVWWGLRSSADGTGPGLHIVIMGGDHADVPLDKSAGVLVADLIVDDEMSVVLDLSNFTQGEQVKFMTDFAERLYHRNRKPLQLILDEADAFAPQAPMPDERRMLGAMERIVRRGRARGLGVTLITQRPAVLNKNVLTQIECLITLRMTGPQDRKAIEAWIGAYGTDEQGKELIASLADLPIGEAWFWSPAWLNVFQRVKIRTRETYDSSSTPKVGILRTEPKQFADVDLDSIKTRMADLIESHQADDPKELKQRIRELEKQLATRAVETKEITVSIPIVTETELRQLMESATDLLAAADAATKAADRIAATVYDARNICPNVDSTEQVIERHQNTNTPAPAVVQIKPNAASQPESEERISGPQQRILDALAEFGAMGLSQVAKHNLAVFADQSPRSSGYTNNLSRLRVMGFIDYPSPGFVALTDAGHVATCRTIRLCNIEDLHQAWYDKLPKPRVAILQQLISIYPQSVGKEQLANWVGQSPTSSGYTNNLSGLRSLGLIDYPQPGFVAATELLFPEGLR